MTGTFRRVLILAYYFPPMGLSGVQRTVKFAKFLPKYGWKPTVLTVDAGSYYAFDESLLREAEEAGVRIVRTKSLDMNHLLRKKGVVKAPSERMRKILQYLGDLIFIPDTKIGWKRHALRAARELFEHEEFDLILATAPPYTAFLVGAELKKRYQIPLVLDYRDAWLEYPFKYYPTPLHRYLHKRLERRAQRAADRVVVTHRRLKECLLKRFKQLSHHDVVILSQGFDVEDYEKTDGGEKRTPGKMVITHAGTFYGRRSPGPILHALANVLKHRPELRSRFQFDFVGTQRREDEQLVVKLGLKENVVFSGYLSHRDCVTRLVKSDVLWYVNDNDMSAPGKLYEYFGARKPVLASVVEGYTKMQILESEAAVCVPLLDVKAHEEALLGLLDRFEKKDLPRMSEEFSGRFDRMALTGELAKQFESLMDYDRNAFVRVEAGTA